MNVKQLCFTLTHSNKSQVNQKLESTVKVKSTYIFHINHITEEQKCSIDSLKTKV